MTRALSLPLYWYASQKGFLVPDQEFRFGSRYIAKDRNQSFIRFAVVTLAPGDARKFSRVVVDERGHLRTSIVQEEEEWSRGSVKLTPRIEHHFVDWQSCRGYAACDIICRAINEGVTSRKLVFSYRFPELREKRGGGLVPKPRLPLEDRGIEVRRWI